MLGTWSRRGQHWVYDEAVSCLRPPLAASVGLEAGELMRWLHLVTIGSVQLLWICLLLVAEVLCIWIRGGSVRTPDRMEHGGSIKKLKHIAFSVQSLNKKKLFETI